MSSFTREVRKDTLRLKDQMLYSTKLAGNFPEELKDHLESSLQEGVFKMTKEANEVSLMDIVDMVYSIQSAQRQSGGSQGSAANDDPYLTVEEVHILAKNMTKIQFGANPGGLEEAKESSGGGLPSSNHINKLHSIALKVLKKLDKTFEGGLKQEDCSKEADFDSDEEMQDNESVGKKERFTR